MSVFKRLFTLVLLGQLLGLTSTALAAQWAKVEAAKALVYADAGMQEAIGFVRRGTKVRVGEKAKSFTGSLPLLYQNRVVYISTQDVSSMALPQEKSDQPEGNFELEAIKKTSMIWLGASASSSTVKSDGASEAYNFYGGSVGYRTKAMSSTHFWQFSFSRLSANKSSSGIVLSDFGFSYGIQVLQRLKWNLSYIAGISYIPAARFDYSESFTLNGQGIGFKFGLEGSYRLNQNWELMLSSTYRYDQLSGFGRDESGASFRPVVAGLDLGLALGLRF